EISGRGDQLCQPSAPPLASALPKQPVATRAIQTRPLCDIMAFSSHKNLLRVRPSFQLRIADWSRQEAVNGNPKSAIRNRKSGILIACHLLVSARRFSMSNPKIKFVLGSVVIVAALTWLGFVGFQQSKAYYI